MVSFELNSTMFLFCISHDQSSQILITSKCKMMLRIITMSRVVTRVPLCCHQSISPYTSLQILLIKLMSMYIFVACILYCKYLWIACTWDKIMKFNIFNYLSFKLPIYIHYTVKIII